MKYLPSEQIASPAAGVSEALRLCEVCTLSSQFLCQSLMLGDVHGCTVKRFENSTFKNRNTHAANVPYLPIWSNNPLRHVTATALLMHHPDGFSHGGSVLRVDCSQILLKVRDPVLRVKTVNFVYLVRPIDTQIVRPTDT